MSEDGDVDVCRKCGEPLVVSEIEIHNEMREIGAFCPDALCEMYKILIV